MFTHDELEVIPKDIAKIFKDMELKILEDIVRRIKLTNEISSSADYQINRLYQLGISKKEIKKYIKEALRLSDEKIDDLYGDVIRKGYVRDKKLYESVGEDFIPFNKNKELQNMIKTVSSISKSEILNLSNSLGFVIDNTTGKKYVSLSDYYINKLNEAVFQINSGTFDYNTILKNTVKEMVNSGIRVIGYESGYHNRVDVAVRRAVMSGLNQITNKISDDNMKNLNTEYAEVSFHLTARPTHQVWQGRVWSKEELVSVCGLGEVTGLLGANCYHHYDAFIPGVSIRQYSDEFLKQKTKEMNSKKEFGQKEYTKYEAIQKQRELERNLRGLKDKIYLLEKGGGDYNDILNTKIRYQKNLQFYNDFSKSMNLKVQMERVNIAGLSLKDKNGISVLNSDLEIYLKNKDKYKNRDEITKLFKDRYSIGFLNDARLPEDFNLKSVYIENHVISHILTKHKGQKIVDYLKNIDTALNFDFCSKKDNHLIAFKILDENYGLECMIKKDTSVKMFHALVLKKKRIIAKHNALINS